MDALGTYAATAGGAAADSRAAFAEPAEAGGSGSKANDSRCDPGVYIFFFLYKRQALNH